jgi:membrane protein YdbS with pleckstrin-like domain
MANNEKGIVDAIKKVFMVLIIVAIVYTWFLWCKEKPLRFLYSLVVLIVLYLVYQLNAHPFEILTN